MHNIPSMHTRKYRFRLRPISSSKHLVCYCVIYPISPSMLLVSLAAFLGKIPSYTDIHNKSCRNAAISHVLLILAYKHIFHFPFFTLQIFFHECIESHLPEMTCQLHSGHGQFYSNWIVLSTIDWLRMRDRNRRTSDKIQNNFWNKILHSRKCMLHRLRNARTCIFGNSPTAMQCIPAISISTDRPRRKEAIVMYLPHPENHEIAPLSGRIALGRTKHNDRAVRFYR